MTEDAPVRVGVNAVSWSLFPEGVVFTTTPSSCNCSILCFRSAFWRSLGPLFAFLIATNSDRLEAVFSGGIFGDISRGIAAGATGKNEK